jgi:hypothetical protein
VTSEHQSAASTITRAPRRAPGHGQNDALQQGNVSRDVPASPSTVNDRRRAARAARRGTEPMGATGMNNLRTLRTRVDNQERLARGHELIRTGPDARTGIYGSKVEASSPRP